MININSLDKLIEDSENEILNIRPDTEKKIIWANQNKVKTKISLIFIHGFSATRAELDPVIEMLGKELNANIFFTRLRGHGLDGEALAELCSKGLGLTQLPHFIARDWLKANSIVPISPFLRSAEGVYCIYPKREFLPTKVKVLIDYLLMKIEQNGENTYHTWAETLQAVADEKNGD